MKIQTLTALLASALALTACGGMMNPMPQQHQHNPQQPMINPTQTQFVCENGDKVTITHFGGDFIDLALKYDVTPPKTVRLPQVASGSGEKYASNQGFFGYGAEWHQKGQEAFFSYNSNEGGMNLNCMAQ